MISSHDDRCQLCFSTIFVYVKRFLSFIFLMIKTLSNGTKLKLLKREEILVAYPQIRSHEILSFSIFSNFSTGFFKIFMILHKKIPKTLLAGYNITEISFYRMRILTLQNIILDHFITSKGQATHSRPSQIRSNFYNPNKYPIINFKCKGSTAWQAGQPVDCILAYIAIGMVIEFRVRLWFLLSIPRLLVQLHTQWKVEPNCQLTFMACFFSYCRQLITTCLFASDPSRILCSSSDTATFIRPWLLIMWHPEWIELVGTRRFHYWSCLSVND